MGPFNEKTLTPKGLTIDKQFVCSASAFRSSIAANRNIISAPHTKQEITEYFKFSEAGANELRVIVYNMISSMDKIHATAQELENTYNEFGKVCDKILDLAAAAPRDYQEIFDGLDKLYKCRTYLDMRTTRDTLMAKLDAREAYIRETSASVKATKGAIAERIDKIDLAQKQLQKICGNLCADEIRSRLLQKFCPDMAQMALNITAVESLRTWVAELDFTKDIRASVMELQKIVGGFNDIMWDHSCVRDYVEIIEIGSVPTSHLQEAIIFKTWKDLHEQVSTFKAEINKHA
ncbi:hypothetical protein E4U23_005734 [Claviceps purpurea]|nr:hypothetical protein E4U11_002761 [Claviceps purpurea]KAG6206751.1 hypothetical protein E4U50_004093 [Claviceps purpurea]KAG6245028.1 hypothetical protein E4U23_005734 [Claviceps purpurea]